MNNVWDEKHKEYVQADWIKKPSLFAQWAIQYFPKQGRVLDLGSGQGQDSRFFAQQGYKVVSTDYSQEALKLNREQLDETSRHSISVEELDLTKPFPYPEGVFDIVYAHLSLHYFNTKITEQIFSEIYRVLRPTGVLALMVNSTKDPEYKECNKGDKGKKLEEDYFEMKEGMKKRFFNVKTLPHFTEQFHAIVLDDQGETYKDRGAGIANLIRFVGKKF